MSGDGDAAHPDEKQDSDQELLRQQTVLARFGELALNSESLDDILTEACRLVGNALGTELAKVVELQADGATLLVRAGVGWKPGVVGETRLEVNEETSEGHALRSGKPVVSADIDRETRFRYPAFLTDNGVRSFVNVPIIGAGDRPAYGLLQVDSRTPRAFTESDIGFLRSYANLLAAAVERLRVMRELRDSLNLQRAAFGTGLIGSFDWDIPGGRVRADGHFAAFHGLDPAATAAGVPPGDILARIHPGDRAAVAAEISAAQATLADYATEFRLVRPDGSLCWLMVRGHCYEQAEGRPIRYTGTAVDVTGAKRAEQALRASNEALEARVAARTRELSTANDRLRAEAAERERIQEALGLAQRLETLFEYLPVGAALVGGTGRVILANPEFRRLLPRAAIPSAEPDPTEEWIGHWPDGSPLMPRDFPGARALRGQVVLGGEFLHRRGGEGERWRRVSGIPVRSADDQVVAALVVIVDIDEEKRAAERQLLLTREVDHRAKNMLAVVQAALRLTRAEDVGQYIDLIEGRVKALARAQSQLAADNWSGADLHGLLRGELAAFLSRNESGPRVELHGPRLALPPAAAQAFSMALHELATNAVKYGALSSQTGRLLVEWHVAAAPEPVLRLRWTEIGGPPPENPPQRQGFGSRVLDGTLRRQLGGRVTRSWQPGGLVCEVEIPLAVAERLAEASGAGDLAASLVVAEERHG